MPLHPDLPRNPFAAPEIGTVAILQLNAQFAGIRILPLQLTLHEHQRVFDLFQSNRLASLSRPCKQSLKILFENRNLGLDRMAMVALGIHDIRELFTDNLDLIRSTKGAF